jgi:predicted ATPase
VVFVSLVAVSKAEDLYSAILEALSTVVGADSRLRILGLLKPKELLLVLDNFEHLIAAAPMVTDLLEGASKLRILITSREALHLRSEQLLEITGFPMPDDLFPLGSQETVLLFERHAKRSGLGIVWQANDLELVQRIHRAVVGSPLGLSLAAGLLRILTLEQIALELERNLAVLAAQPNSDIPVRHRSLEAVFQTSWNLLSSAEQQVLARLSVLNAGFEFVLAKHLTGASQELLLRLAGKSLISRRGQRLYIHEVIRQYAQIHLSETERDQSLALLLSWVFDLAKVAREQTGEAKESETYKAMDDEYDHLRLAAEWGVIHQPLEVAQILKYLTRFFAQRGHTQDQVTWLGLLLADSRIQENPLVLGYCSEIQGYCYFIYGQIGKMFEHAKIVLEIARQHHDPMLENRALRLHHIYAWEQKDDHQALIYAKASLALCQEHGFEWNESVALMDIGCCYLEMGRFEEAEAVFSQSFLIGQKTGDQHGMATTMTYHAQLYGKRQDYETERAWLLECLVHFQATENRIHEVTVLTPLGINAVRRGAYPEARRYLLQRQQLAQQSGYIFSLIYSLSDYAYLEFHEQNHEKAGLLLFICQHLLHQRDALCRSCLSLEMLLAHLGQAKLDMLERKAAFYDLERGLELAQQKSSLPRISSQSVFSTA